MSNIDKIRAEIERLKHYAEESKMEWFNDGYNQNAFAEDCRIKSFDKLLAFIDTLEEPVSDDLEEAAKKYSMWCLEQHGEYCHEDPFVCFKAGAEWQSKRDQETIETAEDHAFLAGSNWQKEQMVRGGLEGEVCGRVKDHINVRFPDGLCKYLKPENISHIPADVKKYKVGDKVRVIIVKEG